MALTPLRSPPRAGRARAQVFTGHRNAVLCLALSRAAGVLVSGSNDRDLRVFRLPAAPAAPAHGPAASAAEPRADSPAGLSPGREVAPRAPATRGLLWTMRRSAAARALAAPRQPLDGSGGGGGSHGPLTPGQLATASGGRETPGDEALLAAEDGARSPPCLRAEAEAGYALKGHFSGIRAVALAVRAPPLDPLPPRVPLRQIIVTLRQVLAGSIDSKCWERRWTENDM
jgi:hypothetical protein